MSEAGLAVGSGTGLTTDLDGGVGASRANAGATGQADKTRRRTTLDKTGGHKNEGVCGFEGSGLDPSVE